MDFHGCLNTQSALESAEIVISDVILNHLDQLFPAGEAPAIVSLPLQDPPEALHGAVIYALSNPGHALGDTGRSQLIMENLRGIGAAPVAVEKRVDAGIGAQSLIQRAVHQSRVIGIPDSIGDDSPVAQVQDGAQIELAHRGSHIVVKLRHIGEPLLVGAVRIKPAVEYVFCQMSGRGCRPGAALWGMLYHGLNPQATADAQRPFVIDRCVVIPVQVVPNAAVALVRAFLVNLLHQPRNTLVLGDTNPGLPGAPPIVACPGNTERPACRLYRKARLFRAAAHRSILLFLPELPQRSPLSSSFTFFRRYNSIFSSSFSCFNRAFSIRKASSRLRGF